MKNPIRVCESLKEDCMLRKCPLPPSSRFQHARRPGAKSRAVSTFPNGSDLQAPGTAVGGGGLFLLFHPNPLTHLSPISRHPLLVQSLALALGSCRGSVCMAQLVVLDLPVTSTLVHVPQAPEATAGPLPRGAQVPVVDQLPKPRWP